MKMFYGCHFCNNEIQIPDSKSASDIMLWLFLRKHKWKYSVKYGRWICPNHIYDRHQKVWRSGNEITGKVKVIGEL